MSTKDMLLWTLAAGLAVFALYQVVWFKSKASHTGTTTGEILETETSRPAFVRRGNVKRATLKYTVEGRNYVSENKIQVPLSFKKGDKHKVYYDTENPVHLYPFNLMQVIVYLVMAVICAAFTFLV